MLLVAVASCSQLLTILNSANQKSPAAQPLIYVVDDVETIAELLVIFLKLKGYRTKMFLDPLEALAAFEMADPKPALLISDFTMPGMNGMELIGRCKALSPELKTISFSGTLYEDSEIEYYAVKPDVALRKPSRLNDLLVAVRQLLAKETPKIKPGAEG